MHLVIIILLFSLLLLEQTEGIQVNGQWCGWDRSNTCPQSCRQGNALRVQIRVCGCPDPANGGATCRGAFVRLVPCECSTVDEKEEEVVITHGQWCPWRSTNGGACSRTCGSGFRTRSRTCACPAPSLANGGSRCVGSAVNTFSCTILQPCADVNPPPPDPPIAACSPAPLAQCVNGRCSRGTRCNGVVDCPGGSDERNCPAACNGGGASQIRCPISGDCVDLRGTTCVVNEDCSDRVVDGVCDDKFSCGKRPKRGFGLLVIGGELASKAELPWTGALFQDSRQICGATLLNKRWIVTAAHCISDRANRIPGILSVKLGILNLTNAAKSGVTMQGSRVIKHAAYDQLTFANDIALIQLRGNVPLSTQIQPVCLPTRPVAIGDTCVIAGWGEVSANGIGPRDRLMRADVPVIGASVCNRPTWYDGLVRDASMFCAGFADGRVDACQGDSGGPLVCLGDRREGYILHGVTSWGSGCAEPNHPGVYTRVETYVPWITENLQ